MEEKLLYISDYPLNTKSGHGNMIRAHHEIIKRVVQDNIIEIYGNCDKEIIANNLHCFKGNSKIEKIKTVLLGNPPYISLEFEKAVIDIIKNNNIDVLFVENSVSGNLLKKIKKINCSIKIVVYFPDIEAVLMQSQIHDAHLFRKISLKMMIKNEKKTVRYADEKIVLNCRDFELYKSIYGECPSCIIPIIVDIPRYDKCAIHKMNTPLNLLFVGVDYYPNVFGVEWFIKNVEPLVSVQHNVLIVGRGMEKYKDKWEQYSCVKVVGTVESLNAYYEEADAVIAPIFEGGGMKVKSAEALAHGKILIGTKESTFGYWENASDLKNIGIYNTDDPKEMAVVIESLYEKNFEKYNKKIIEWVERDYSINSGVAKFKSLICR